MGHRFAGQCMVVMIPLTLCPPSKSLQVCRGSQGRYQASYWWGNVIRLGGSVTLLRGTFIQRGACGRRRMLFVPFVSLSLGSCMLTVAPHALIEVMHSVPVMVASMVAETLHNPFPPFRHTLPRSLGTLPAYGYPLAALCHAFPTLSQPLHHSPNPVPPSSNPLPPCPNPLPTRSHPLPNLSQPPYTSHIFSRPYATLAQPSAIPWFSLPTLFAPSPTLLQGSPPTPKYSSTIFQPSCTLWQPLLTPRTPFPPSHYPS